MKNIATIAAVNLKRLGRDRIGAFFVFVFPVVLILLLGVVFGDDSSAELGVSNGSSGPLARDLVTDLDGSSIEVTSYEDAAPLRDDVESGRIDAGIIVPVDYEDLVRAEQTATVSYLARTGDLSNALRATVTAAVQAQSAQVGAARIAVREGVANFADALAAARRIDLGLPGVEVSTEVVGGAADADSLGAFDLGAASQLILFTFVTSLGGAAALVQTRNLGISRRLLSAPMRPSTILLGEATGRFLIAMVQGVFIIVVAALLFGVHWGDPVAASALVILFSLVSTGAAMLFGAILSNEQQAGALIPLGLALAALGGCMVPLEVFPATMRTIAHATPHAWAIEGFTELIRRDAGVGAILPQLGVLAVYAAGLLSVASWRLGKAILG
jgi:ABC-2 type transport system permease protein